MPLDPDDGADSPALEAILRGPAAALTAVVLMAGEQARASGWAARAAVAIARHWPGPRRVVLVDLDVANPALHELAGVPNEGGIIDVIELGTSLHRVAVPAAAARFQVVPAGPFPGDSGLSLLTAEAWPRMLYDAAARRDTLLLYVPAATPDAAALVERVGTVLVLALEAETKSIVERLPRRYAVLAVLEPAVQETLTAPIGASVTAATDGAAHAGLLSSGEARAALVADLRKRQRAARLLRRAPAQVAVPPASTRQPEPVASDDAATTAFPDTDDMVATAAVSGPGELAAMAVASEVARETRLQIARDGIPLDALPPATPVLPRRRRRVQPISFTLFVVLVVSVIAGSLHFLAGRLRRPASVAPAVTAPVDSPVAPSATPAPLPPDAVAYSVALEAHQNVATALERVDALTAAQSDLSFYVAPLERGGVLRYHLMAGPVADSAAALALRDTLRARGIKTTYTPTDIRYTPLALLIGDYSGRADAEQQVAELRRLDIPAYLVVGVAADSAPLYRVFVGGFGGPAEADVARQLLRAAGVRDHLVNRTRSSTR